MAQKCSELGFLVSSSVLWDDEDALNGNYNYNYYSDLWSGLPLPSSVAATARTSAEDSIPQVVAVSEALESDCGRVTTTTTNNNNVSADTQLSCETAATSSSGGSMSSPSKSNKVNESSKKKVLMGTQDNEYHSQKAQEDSDENFKQCSTGTSSKRSRAAEVHNLSEKRRRNRINEKMKALQSLIPNSNKTDKASMLDEAIEYLKKLQLQVQMLSARSGIDISSMRWLAQMPHLQMQQIPKACITTDQHAEVSLGMPLGPGLMNTDQGSEKRPLPLHDLCNSGGFGKTAIPINLPSERIDDHQSCIMDAPQGNFSLPQLPTTTQKFMR